MIRRARGTGGVTVIVLGLAVTAVLPTLTHSAVLVPAALIAVAWAVMLMVGRASPGGEGGGRLVAARELLLHLAPVALLMVAYPLAAQRIQTSIGGTPLLALLLASSVTVPWLSQSACLPMYRAIGDLLPVRGDAAVAHVERRMVAAWPRIFVQSTPAVLLFALPLQLVFGWSAQALGAYLVLAVLHLLFAQSVVLTNVARRRGLWALSWLAYAAILFVAPTWWFLPPIFATAVQLWSVRGSLWALLPRGRHHDRIALRPVSLPLTWADITKGFFLGSVLWADKLLLFAATKGTFDVDVVYLSMLPVVLAYNYYFVRLAPMFDRHVLQVRHALEHQSFDVLGRTSRTLVEGTSGGLIRTAAVGSLLSAGICAVVIALNPEHAALVVAVSVASWLFMSATLLGYKLDYVGRSDAAMTLGAAHLVLAIIAFATLPVLPAYTVLIVGEAALVAVAARITYVNWSSPSYTLFWRHATSW